MSCFSNTTLPYTPVAGKQGWAVSEVVMIIRCHGKKLQVANIQKKLTLQYRLYLVCKSNTISILFFVVTQVAASYSNRAETFAPPNQFKFCLR